MNKTAPKKTEPISVLVADRMILQAIAAATDGFPYQHVHEAIMGYLASRPRLAAVAAAALAVSADVAVEATTVGATR